MYFDWKRQTSTDSTASSCGKHSWEWGICAWDLGWRSEICWWWWESAQVLKFSWLIWLYDVFLDVCGELFHQLQLQRFGPQWRTSKDGIICTLKTYLTSGKTRLFSPKLFIWDVVPRASQMGVYPGGAFQEEEEDADVKRMKVQWRGWVHASLGWSWGKGNRRNAMETEVIGI